VGIIKSKIQNSCLAGRQANESVKDYFVICILSFVFLFSSGFSFSDAIDPLYQNVREQATKSFQDLFSGKVTIEKAGGILVGSIDLLNVKIGEDLVADKVVIIYDPVKYLLNKTDIVPAITTIEIYNGKGKIIRNKKGVLNALSFFKPPQKGVPGVPFKANVKFINTKLSYVDELGLPYKNKPGAFFLEKLEGNLNMKKAPKISFDFKGLAENQSALQIKGNADLSSLKHNISGSIKNLGISSINDYLIPSYDFKSGAIDLSFKIKDDEIDLGATGRADNLNFNSQTAILLKNLKVSSIINFSDSEIYGQKFSGKADLLYQNSLLTVNPSSLRAYGGETLLQGDYDTKTANFSLVGNFMGINIRALKAPGIEGLASGQIELTGKLEAFSGKVESTLSQASAFGQNIKEASGAFTFSKGTIDFEGFKLLSDEGGFFGYGKMGKRRDFDIYGKAFGLRMSGEGILGHMEAYLDNFNGSMSFTADEKFLKNPLKNLSAFGSFEVSSVQLGEQSIDLASGLINLKMGRIAIKNTMLAKNNSILLASGEIGYGKNDMEISGKSLKLTDFKILNVFLPEGAKNPQGTANLNLHLFGNLDDLLSLDSLYKLSLEGKLEIKEAKIGKFFVNELSTTIDYENTALQIGAVLKVKPYHDIKAKLLYAKGVLKFVEPLAIESDDNNFLLSGSLNINDGKEEAGFLIGINKASVSSLSTLYEDFYPQLISTPPHSILKNEDKLYPPELNSESQVFLKGGKQSEFLDFFQKILDEVKKYRKAMQPPLLQKMSGEIEGKIKINGKISNPSIETSLKINKGSYGKYKFDSLNGQVDYQNDEVSIKKLELKKNGGNSVLQGSLNLKNKSANLRLRAQKLSIDILNLVLDKKVEGSFNLDSQITGKFDALTAVASIKTNKVNLAGVDFDGIEASLGFTKNLISIDKLSLINGDDFSSVYGDISLGGDANLLVSLEGNSLGLINLLNDELSWKKGKARGAFSISLTNWTPEVKGWLQVLDSSFYSKTLNAHLLNTQINLLAQNNIFTVERVMGYLSFDKAPSVFSFISLAGSLDLNNNQLKASLRDTKLSVQMPNLYSGNVFLENFSISGGLGGLKLFGNAKFENGIIFLPQGGQVGQGGEPAVPLDLALSVDFGENLYLVGGDISTLTLSNILFNLQMYGQGLQVGGNLLKPKLWGSVFFNSGSISIFGRDFVLQNRKQQEAFYRNDLEKIQDNYAKFSGEGISPYLNVIASAKTQHTIVSPVSPAENQTENITVLSQVRGLLFTKEKNQGIEIGLQAYKEDRTKSPTEYVLQAFSEQDIRVMLLPDFVKTATGLEKGKTDYNAAMADYLDSRLQSYLFIGLERQLEKAFGLSSLTMDYNFGSDFRKAMGSSGPTDKPALAVGFAKALFDKLYLEVNYTRFGYQTASTNNRDEAVNYQLTYKLSRNISLAYYREPLTVYDLQSGPAKITLYISHNL